VKCLVTPPNNIMASNGYYKICPKCFRKYGRHFTWCIDCTPRAKRNKDGSYGYSAYRTKYGTINSRDRVDLHFCCSKKLPLDKRLAICDKCRTRFKCFTEAEDN
jgi:hypothetical protein